MIAREKCRYDHLAHALIELRRRFPLAECLKSNDRILSLSDVDCANSTTCPSNRKRNSLAEIRSKGVVIPCPSLPPLHLHKRLPNPCGQRCARQSDKVIDLRNSGIEKHTVSFGQLCGGFGLFLGGKCFVAFEFSVKH